MKNLTKHVQNLNARYGLWARGDVLVVGVSGGRDSMCLLWLLHNISRKEHLQIIVAHVNYNLRAEDSLHDQQLVEETASEYGFHFEVLNVPKEEQGSSENDWRNIRRAYFHEIAQKYGASKILLAHTMNDHAETLLLHLLRGAGLAGLSNMSFLTSFHELTIARPLLDVSRDDITTHCAEMGIRYHDDLTNDDDTFTRNRIRNNLLPYLQENFEPDIVSRLAQTAQIVADDMTQLDDIQQFWQTEGTPTHTVSFLYDELSQLSTPQQRRSLRELFVLLLPERFMSFGFVEEVRIGLSLKKNADQKFSGNGLIITAKGATVKIMLKD